MQSIDFIEETVETAALAVIGDAVAAEAVTIETVALVVTGNAAAVETVRKFLGAATVAFVVASRDILFKNVKHHGKQSVISAAN